MNVSAVIDPLIYNLGRYISFLKKSLYNPGGFSNIWIAKIRHYGLLMCTIVYQLYLPEGPTTYQ